MRIASSLVACRFLPRALAVLLTCSLLGSAALVLPVGSAHAAPGVPALPAAVGSGAPALTLHYQRSLLPREAPPNLISSDAQGNVYVSDDATTTTYDATAHQVVMYDASGNKVRTFGSANTSDPGYLDAPGGSAVSGANLYVNDSGTSGSACNCIKFFTVSSGAYVGTIGSAISGLPNGLMRPTGMTVDHAGNLYVFDAGAIGNTQHSRIVVLSPTGTLLKYFGVQGSCSALCFQDLYGMAFDSAGYLYVVDQTVEMVKKINVTTAPPTVARTWGSPANTPSTTPGQFGGPIGLAIDRSNFIYIADPQVNPLACCPNPPLANSYPRIQKFDTQGNLIGSYSTIRQASASNVNNNGYANGELGYPFGIAVSQPDGAPPVIFISDIGTGAIQGFELAVHPGSHNTQAAWGAAGVGHSGPFNIPAGVAVDGGENVYVADNGNNLIEKFDKYGNYLAQWGGVGTGNGQFNGPLGMAVDGNGHIFVVDSGNNRVQVFNSSGTYQFQFNDGGSLAGPSGIAIDSANRVYVTDTGNDRVVVFDDSGNLVTTFGSAGTGEGQFTMLTGIAVDNNLGQAFVADGSNPGRIQVFDTLGFNGTITFVNVFPQSQSGPGALNSPTLMTTDQRGDLYVADNGNNRIAQFNEQGFYLTSYGSAGTGNGQFNGVGGLAVNAKTGQLYAADPGNGRVQQIGSPMPTVDTPGVWRPSTKTFYLRNSNTTGPADIVVPVPWAQSTDLPVVGDWFGEGVDTIGFYRPSLGVFFLQDTNTTQTGPDAIIVLGTTGDTPMAGDWNGSGKTGVGIFRPSNGIIYTRNTLTSGYADYVEVLGIPGDHGIAGDWNGDGQETPGVYRPSKGTFYLSNKLQNGVTYSNYTVTFGTPNEAPFNGDWIAQGHDGLGVINGSSGLTFERNSLTTGPADQTLFYGTAGDMPVAGHWGVVPTAAAPHSAPPSMPSTPAPAHVRSTPAAAEPVRRGHPLG